MSYVETYLFFVITARDGRSPSLDESKGPWTFGLKILPQITEGKNEKNTVFTMFFDTYWSHPR